MELKIPICFLFPGFISGTCVSQYALLGEVHDKIHYVIHTALRSTIGNLVFDTKLKGVNIFKEVYQWKNYLFPRKYRSYTD